VLGVWVFMWVCSYLCHSWGWRWQVHVERAARAFAAASVMVYASVCVFVSINMCVAPNIICMLNAFDCVPLKPTNFPRS